MPNVQKWITRINDSKWTRIFLACAILQTIIVLGLEGAILFENFQAMQPLTTAKASPSFPDKEGVSTALDRLNRIKWENVAFIAFQLWALWLSFDGIINQNTVEIIAIAVINGLCAVVGVVQAADSAKWINYITALKLDISDLTTGEKIEIAQTTFVFLFAGFSAFVSWKLYQSFGWNIYKKIGADLDVQVMYKTFQYFVLILKINIFFQFLSSGFYLIQWALKEGFRWETVYLSVVTALVLPALILGRASVSTESRMTMIIFISFQGLILTHFGLILSQTLLPRNNWYFWIFVVWCGIILTVATAVIAYLCMRKFGTGLKPYVQRGSRKSMVSGAFGPDGNAFADGGVNGKAWEIDDVQNNEELARFDLEGAPNDRERLHSVDLSERYAQQNSPLESRFAEKILVE
ncbi:hypothetical protein BC938DRAFT_475861 [Jimgerdemannia flammicorona]|uniref:TRP C-terminal domain-containing protein n=1 Tax=Jimgerdemannia flammicorona TaxID=994334 RepID=A0A433QR86_9FUNG|nr:hypothetical protein BC938DRAFT_475861 [Jimgerdemannia flammicorona]